MTYWGAVISAKQMKILTVWRGVRCAVVSPDIPRKECEEGSKDPWRRRQRRRCVRRGSRGGRSPKGERVGTQQIPSTSTTPCTPSAIKVGNGSRSRRFRKNFEQSVEAMVGTAQQIMDIRDRAQSRARLDRIPLPPKAKAGLQARQRRLIRRSRRWGDAYASATGESAAAGRLFWRNLLFQKSFSGISHTARASQQEVFETSSAYTTEVAMSRVGDFEDRDEAPAPTLRRGFCRNCGDRTIVSDGWCLPCHDNPRGRWTGKSSGALEKARVRKR